ATSSPLAAEANGAAGRRCVRTLLTRQAGVHRDHARAPVMDEHREHGTVTARDCFGMKAVMWISARSEPTIVGSPIDPPVDPPGTVERVRGRSKPLETTLDNRDMERLPADEHAIFSRGFSLPWRASLKRWASR